MIKECSFIPTIPTKDMAASRRFYEETLGLQVAVDDEDMGVWYRAGGSMIYLYETPHAGTAQHTLVSIESDHIDDDIQELRDHGVSFEVYPDLPFVEWDGDVAHMSGGDQGSMKGVWFKDPAGNVLGMFEKAPVLAHA